MNYAYSCLILIFLNQTLLPWSCKSNRPLRKVPKSFSVLNLLLEIMSLQFSSHIVVDTTVVPFTFSSSFAFWQITSIVLHSVAGNEASGFAEIISYKSPERCLMFL